VKLFKKEYVLSILFTLVSGCAIDHTVVTGSDFKIEGQGDVLVVLESGAGDGPESWQPIRKALADIATVVSYDRPRWFDTKVTGEEVAANLQRLLQKHHLNKPIVLVGHSLGDPFVLSFAKKYPQQVKGIVLIDGRPAGFSEACKQAGGQMCDIPQLMKLALPLWVTAEVNGLTETYRQHEQYTHFPEIPVIVISATKPPMLSDDVFMRVWLEKQAELSKQFVKGTFIAVPNVGHYIHQEQPELIISEISKIVVSK
jgi:pimeloyl-ACP methyl ester carboxylesterase